ncbi:MAG TPA: outer membrane beta-barrel protein [Gammaproteobacteria bacterium]|nr:outer membrane beta-barrel protein [Gammaproteobacteria bacterium]
MKKRIALTLLSFAMISPIHAGTPYLGIGAQYMDIFSGSAGFQGISPRVMAGYGSWLTDSFYLAAEAFLSAPPFTLINNTAPNGSLSISWNYGISVLPGVYLDDALMGFLRLGVFDTRFRNLNTYRIGYQMGIGLDYVLANPLSLRAEYDYGQYPSFSGFSVPKSSEVGVSLIYRFF